MPSKPQLTIGQILSWADDHREQTGDWPHADSGIVAANDSEKWVDINQALRLGYRGLPGNDSLACLLQRERGHRHLHRLPPLTEEQIVVWARAHHERTGTWPVAATGVVAESPDMTWQGIDACLRDGLRDLPGGNSLARLLDRCLGVHNRLNVPALTGQKILRWADAHHEQTGQWPKKGNSACDGLPEGETWFAIDAALEKGARGLPGGSSLPRLLAEHRQVRNKSALPRLSKTKILRWARAYRQRHGKWPVGTEGAVEEAPGETWKGIDMALRQGLRGLPDGSSLAKFLKGVGS